MPPSLLNRQLREVRAISGWQDPAKQLAIGQVVGNTAWKALSLKGGEAYAGFEQPAVRREQNGLTVRLRGVIKATEKLAVNHVVAVLPKLFRPSGSVVLTTIGANKAVGIVVNTAGEMLLAVAEVPAGEGLNLDGLTYNLT